MSQQKAKLVKFELDQAGVRALLRSDETAKVCKQYADRVAARAGWGFDVTTYTGKNRANASVKAVSDDAASACFEDNVLVKALFG